VKNEEDSSITLNEKDINFIKYLTSLYKINRLNMRFEDCFRDAAAIISVVEDIIEHTESKEIDK